MNYNKIKSELERRGITIKDFCRKVDITEQGLHQMIRKESMKIDVLERISTELDVPVSYWFNENGEETTQGTAPANVSDTQKIDNITTELNSFLKSLIKKGRK